MTFEHTLRGDLEALGAECRRDPLPMPETLKAGVYRDGQPGAKARRDELLDQRRHELAFMPLAYSQVFAHRIGRAAAGAMAIVCSIFVMILLGDPIGLIMMPGLDPDTCAPLAVITVLATYVGATWIAERVFERKLRDALTLAGDVHADLDRLGEGPVDVARSLVRRADAWSIGFVIGGAIAVVALFGFVMFVLDAHAHNWHHWSILAVARDMKLVVVALVVGLGLSVVVARRPHPWLAHWTALAVGVVLGAGTLYQGLYAVAKARAIAGVPSIAMRLALATTGVLAVFLVSTFAVLWWRRRENARLV
jgi:hypothetical protein